MMAEKAVVSLHFWTSSVSVTEVLLQHIQICYGG